MTFEDVHAAYSAAGYYIINEEPEVQRMLLGRYRPSKAVAICSAGEVILFCLLSRVRKQLIAVDHSYVSLAVTHMKISILQKLGPKATRALFISEDSKTVMPEIEWAYWTIPETLREAYKKLCLQYNYYGDKEAFKPTSGFDFTGLRKEWFYAPVNVLAASLRNLDKLTLVHGDLLDVASRGPFDLLYLSNATQHTDRNQKLPDMAKVTNMLRDGGLIVSACQVTTGVPKWKQVKKIRGFRSSIWDYHLYQVNHAEQASK